MMRKKQQKSSNSTSNGTYEYWVPRISVVVSQMSYKLQPLIKAFSAAVMFIASLYHMNLLTTYKFNFSNVLCRKQVGSCSSVHPPVSIKFTVTS